MNPICLCFLTRTSYSSKDWQQPHQHTRSFQVHQLPQSPVKRRLSTQVSFHFYSLTPGIRNLPCWLCPLTLPDPLSFLLHFALCPGPWDANLDGLIHRSILLSVIWLALVMGCTRMTQKERRKIKSGSFFILAPCLLDLSVRQVVSSTEDNGSYQVPCSFLEPRALGTTPCLFRSKSGNNDSL